MIEQRHRIRRQVLEIHVPDEAAGRQLQLELGRVHRQRLVPLIDRCLTEASQPDRLHRLDSLVVDLGVVDAENLERDLVDKLGPGLRQALAEGLRGEEREAVAHGAEPGTASRLELLDLFARTGTTPWWADSTRPDLPDESLEWLIRHAPRSLAAWMRSRIRDGRWQGAPFAAASAVLKRIVLHTSDERLSELFGVLVSSPSSTAPRRRQLEALLRASPAVPGAPPVRFISTSWRSTVWQAALRTACHEGARSGEAVSFWRMALAEVAGQLATTPASLVSELHRSFAARRGRRPGTFAAVVERLYREVATLPAASEATLPAEVSKELARLLQEALEEAALDEPVVKESARDEAEVEKAALDQVAVEDAARDEATVAEAARDEAEAEKAGFEEAAVEDTGDESAGSKVARRRRESDQILEWLAALMDRHRPDIPSDRLLQDLGRLLRELIERQPSLRRDREGISLSPDVLRRCLAELQDTSPARKAGDEGESRAPDFSTDSDVVYVENSGLVLLWPFLGHFFERLELMSPPLDPPRGLMSPPP